MIIDDKNLIFGHGDIVVGFNCKGLTFAQLVEPTEAGATLTPKFCVENNIKFGDTVTIPLGIHNINGLQNLLKSAQNGLRIFKYVGFTFDFTNYKKESIDVVLRHLENFRSLWLLTYAC